ncbi:sensor histidine kinase [Sphingomonas sp.]|jgi:signal transduction histidine kinase|uniref:sensor histidine kinase n=1 Tax=Sphingomonas sp. TaxID=28214 RepID=UPI002DBC1896|nr:ATP-binding protein [Sphingomonas sp.]HEU4968080.1 ATP-binding protein [Sphingomonas sp.]
MPSDGPGFRGQFALGLAWRMLLLLAMLAAFAASLAAANLGAARIIAAALVVAAAIGLWNYIQRTNLEIARFVEAIRFGDMSASFARPEAGSGFEALGAALDSGIRALRDERSRMADESRFYQAIVDDLPIALLLVDPEERVEPVGKTARRMFGALSGVRVDDYAQFGAGFAQCLRGLQPGQRQLVTMTLEGGQAQRVLLRVAAVHRLGGSHRVITVQPIQEALNAVEIATQSDLVRVLTHEIMNSMTPVTSLARTAADLMADADTGKDETIADARAAVETLARRADGVMHFVESYRQISRTPQVNRQVFVAASFGDELRRLFQADWPAERIGFDLSVQPETMMLDADPDLLAQVLINLLRNGADAAETHGPEPRVAVRFEAARGGGATILVDDNGPGIPEAKRSEVFLPFFTTKAKGTGVGLSLARQIVLAHDGTIAIEQSDLGGARFRIVL